MPATLETREDGRVQFFSISDPFSLPELTSLYPADDAYRNSVNFTVHTLIDLTALKHLPSGILGTRTGAPILSHPRSGQIVLTGAVPLAKALGEMIARLTRINQTKVNFFRTVDEGWDFLRHYIEEDAKKLNVS